jgi:hypothetical protein
MSAYLTTKSVKTQQLSQWKDNKLLKLPTRQSIIQVHRTKQKHGEKKAGEFYPSKDQQFIGGFSGK